VLEITDTTDKTRSTSYLDNLEIDSEGWVRMKLYDKTNLNFPIANIPSTLYM